MKSLAEGIQMRWETMLTPFFISALVDTKKKQQKVLNIKEKQNFGLSASAGAHLRVF